METIVNIILSPSQQSQNKCAMGDSERDHCFKIAKRVYDLLQNYDCNSCVIAKGKTLAEVVEISNNFAKVYSNVPSFHLDIHTDAGYKGKGCSGFYYSENGRQFISIIQSEVAKITPWEDSGVTERGGLYVLSHTTSIAGLIELSFHDRLDESKHIHDNMNLYTEAILKGLVKACGLTTKSIPKVSKEIEIDKNYKECIDFVANQIGLSEPPFWYKSYTDPETFFEDLKKNPEWFKTFIQKTAIKISTLTQV